MDDLAHRAFVQLYPARQLRHDLIVRYSGRFKDYNATVTRSSSTITFSLSKQYLETSEEIRIGVMQYLLNRLNKTRVESIEQDLYRKFTAKIQDYAPVTDIDPELKEVFDHVNKEYFDDFLMVPNLIWGRGINLLGHYSFGSDTITISRALVEEPELLEFVMYHEMLHKRHGFDESPGGVLRTHTKAFRKDERRFRIPDIERRLEAFVQRKKREQRLATGIRRRKGPIQRLLHWFEL